MNNILKICFLVVLTVSPLGSILNPPAVSMIQLIASPEKYDGKPVTVIGFLRLDPEGDRLFLSVEDYQHDTLNQIWLERNAEITKNRESLDLNYVLVVGVFKAGPISYDLFSAGGITKITSCNLWSELKHPRAEKYKNMPKLKNN